MKPVTTQVACRKCKDTYAPTFIKDFYQDDKDGPGSGLCESCMMNEELNKDPVAVPSEDHLMKVCKMGGGRDTCVFLMFSPSVKGLSCGNHSGLNNTIVNKAVNGNSVSRCINCDGPPSFALKVPPFDYDKQCADQQSKL